MAPTSPAVVFGSGCLVGGLKPSIGVGLKRTSQRSSAQAAQTTICITEMVMVIPPAEPPDSFDASLLVMLYW